MADAISHAFKTLNHPLDNSKLGGFSLWSFYSTMQIGDLVILRGGRGSCVVEVEGDYFFDAQNTPLHNDLYSHQRAMRATSLDSEKIWQRAGKMADDGGSIYRTLIRCQRQLSPADLESAQGTPKQNLKRERPRTID